VALFVQRADAVSEVCEADLCLDVCVFVSRLRRVCLLVEPEGRADGVSFGLVDNQLLEGSLVLELRVVERAFGVVQLSLEVFEVVFERLDLPVFLCGCSLEFFDLLEESVQLESELLVAFPC